MGENAGKTRAGTAARRHWLGVAVHGLAWRRVCIDDRVHAQAQVRLREAREGGSGVPDAWSSSD